MNPWILRGVLTLFLWGSSTGLVLLGPWDYAYRPHWVLWCVAPGYSIGMHVLRSPSAPWRGEITYVNTLLLAHIVDLVVMFAITCLFVRGTGQERVANTKG